MKFADRLNEAVAQWERVNGTRMSSRSLAFRVTQAGHPVSATYVSQLRSGNRNNPTPALVNAIARVLSAELTRCDADAGPECAPADETVAATVTNRTLRRLLISAHGLSPESIEMLADLAGRFRVAEGMTPGMTADM
ncbi:MAG: hypothetical protein J2P18_03880 [Nocardia sp.]|nr:hypothetical protein [Nocardia sp.]